MPKPGGTEGNEELPPKIARGEQEEFGQGKENDGRAKKEAQK
jgi:hypothetical protein